MFALKFFWRLFNVIYIILKRIIKKSAKNIAFSFQKFQKAIKETKTFLPSKNFIIEVINIILISLILIKKESILLHDN